MNPTIYTLLTVAALTSACGPADSDASHLYSVDCVENIRADFAADSAKVARNVRAARQALVVGGVITDAEFCPMFGSTPITIHDEDCVGDKTHTGWFNIFSGIELNRYMDSLAHEYLHGVDLSRFQVGTQWHQDWDKVTPGEVQSHDDIQWHYFQAYQRTAEPVVPST